MPTYLHQHDSIVSMCLTEAADTKNKWEFDYCIDEYSYAGMVSLESSLHPLHFHAKGLLDQGLSMNTIGQKSGYMYIHVNLKKF